MSIHIPLARLEVAGRILEFDLANGRPIAIPLVPGGLQPKFFVDEPATAEPLAAGSFTGQVDTGASCNAGWIRFAPHCHGTHTEGPGHLLAGAPALEAPAGLLLARLASVQPVASGRFRETAPPEAAGGLIESRQLPLEPAPQALVIRTLPNPPAKRHRDYNADPAYPVLSREAAGAIAEAGIRHLLVDTPSLDPSADGGALVNHRAFWQLDRSGNAENRRGCTITEMIYAADDLADGWYLLSLGVSPLAGEASPSSPVLFPAA